LRLLGSERSRHQKEFKPANMLGGKSVQGAGECPAKTKLFGEESEGT